MQRFPAFASPPFYYMSSASLSRLVLARHTRAAYGLSSFSNSNVV